MKHGFVKTAAITPKIRVAQPEFNGAEIIRLAKEAAGNGAKLIVFPELCITGYTCGDLFFQAALIQKARETLFAIADAVKDLDALIFVGLPWEKQGKLYNVAAVLNRGEILGMVPKSNLPNYGEFYEMRYFTPGNREAEYVWLGRGTKKEEYVLFGTDMVFSCAELQELVVAAEICEDLWVPEPPSVRHALTGATVIANCSASDETIGKERYREELIGSQSARLVCGYVYANAGEGESTQDLVFGGQNLIAENGTILGRSERFQSGITYGDIDVCRLAGERRRMNTFWIENNDAYTEVGFHLSMETTKLERQIAPSPFVPEDKSDRERRCEQAAG